MTFRIRAATPQNAPGIALVHVTSWRETYAGLMPPEFLARMTSEEMQQRREGIWQRMMTDQLETVFIAEQGGEVVAFASLRPARDHPGYDVELMTLYALNSCQGKGIGRELLHAIITQSQAEGAKNLALWVLDVNPTRGWYARQGAREAGEKTEGNLREIRMVWDDLQALSGSSALLR